MLVDNLSYTANTYTDTATSGTAVTADKLNSLEQQVKALTDAVNEINKVKIYTESRVCSQWSGNETLLISNDEFKEKFGREFDNTYDSIYVCNGDSDVMNPSSLVVKFYSSSGNIWVYCAGASSGYIRLNCIFALGNK